MRFFEVLFLLGLLMVFSKGQKGGTTGDQPMFDDELDVAAEEAVLEEEPEEVVKDKIDPDVEDEDAEEDVKRQIRPPFRRIVTVPMAIPAGINARVFRLCYCFRRLCYGKYYLV